MAPAQSTSNILQDDLDFILQHATTAFEKLRGQRIFITGGTGFFGTWLLESLVWANKKLDLGTTATVLTRDSRSFQAKAPRIANDTAINFLIGDICTFEFPRETFSYVIHAATESNGQLNLSNPRALLHTNMEGTKRVLAFTKAAECRNFLLTSSGAVYGPQPPEVSHIPETYNGAPDPLSPASAYGEGKRVSELLTAIAAREQEMNAAIARCFAFVGPHLPLDAHYAIGNFVRDGLKGGPLSIQGDGTPRRSYLYASDLAIWLWTLLTEIRGTGIYNVGSEKSVSIKETAENVQQAFAQPLKIEIAKQPDPSKPASIYVPSTEKIRRDFELSEKVSLLNALQKTIEWNKSRYR